MWCAVPLSACPLLRVSPFLIHLVAFSRALRIRYYFVPSLRLFLSLLMQGV